MKEKIIRIIEEEYAHGATYSIVESLGEFGRHYVLLFDGVPTFHSTDLERVEKYMKSNM